MLRRRAAQLRRHERYFALRVAASAAVTAILLACPSIRAVDVVFQYDDPSGTGFHDPVYGQQRQDALFLAGRSIGDALRSSYDQERIVVHVSTGSLNANTLASTHANYFYGNFTALDPNSVQSDTHYAKALASHLHGSDIDPPKSGDMFITFNSNTAFDYDATRINPTILPGTYDFVSVAMHEVLHGLGISSSFHSGGGYGVYGDGTHDGDDTVSGFAEIYDRFLTSGPGGTPITSLPANERVLALTSGNGLYFSGPNARLGNGGNNVALYAPNPFDQGASASHTNPTVLPDDLMNSSLGTGQIRRTISTVDRGILRDLGWDIGVIAGQRIFTGAGGQLASADGNWAAANPLPGDSLEFAQTPVAARNVLFDIELNSIDKMIFDAGAPSHTVYLKQTLLTAFDGAGVINNSGTLQTIVLTTSADSGTFPSGDTHAGTDLSFRYNASAGNANYELHAGFKVPDGSDRGYDYSIGARIVFQDQASAGTATFRADGGTGPIDLAPNAHIEFQDHTTAGYASFELLAGHGGPGFQGDTAFGAGAQVIFEDNATADHAQINTRPQLALGTPGTGGSVLFRDDSRGGHVTISNWGATTPDRTETPGGQTQFLDRSSAENAFIFNHPSSDFKGEGITLFADDASAGAAVINNLAGTAELFRGGALSFQGRSSAATSTITNFGGDTSLAGSTLFTDSARAGAATIHHTSGNNAGGTTKFTQNASAATSNLIIDPIPPDAGGYCGGVYFLNSATAENAHILVKAPGNLGVVYFADTSTAANATVTSEDNASARMQFWNNSNAGSATFRLGANSFLQMFDNSALGSASITVGAGAHFGSSSAGPVTPPANSPTANIHVLGSSSPFSGAGDASYANPSTRAENVSLAIDGAAAPGGLGAILFFDYNARATDSATISLMSSPYVGSQGGQLIFSRGASAQGTHVFTQLGTSIRLNFDVNADFYDLEGSGTIDLSGGSLTIGGSGKDVVYSGSIVDNSGGSPALTKVGPGAFSLTGSNRYAGTTNVNQGSLLLLGSNTLPGNYVVAEGAALYFSGVHSVGQITGFGSVTVNAPVKFAQNAAPSFFNQLTMTSVGQLDISNGKFTTQTPASTIRQYLKNGYVNPSTTPAQSIISSFAAADTMHHLSIAYLTGAPAGLPANQTLVELALSGDANVDGMINASDFTALAMHFGQSGGMLWTAGDFNYDGVVNALDFNFIATNFGASLPASAMSSRSVLVPEPSALLLAALSLPLIRRRPGAKPH